MEIQVSGNFKKNTLKAILSIVLFALVYLLILLASVGLVILCIVICMQLLIFNASFITLFLALAIIAFGVLILIFLVKFFFKKHKIDRSHLIEITKKDEPELFRFIQEIVDEVGTSFPKKVYLMLDVNAGVFFDSSFWSMFFPVKKNLQIGIGLVNSCTEQEIKAILAHEFGHFSQKSMAVGSYVYNINEVIYNMLYDNEGFSNFVSNIASISWLIQISAKIAVKFIQGIQWVLREMYKLINISYMALSRDMEFYADEVAANVAGSVALKRALLRMDLADYSYNTVLNFYNEKFQYNIRSRNIYKEQTFIMNFAATQSGLSFNADLPIVTLADLNKYNKSKLVIKNQWASHPTTEDRVNALDTLNIQKENVRDNLAITLFRDIDKLEESLTDKLFSSVEYEQTPSILEFDDFAKEYKEKYSLYDYDKIFNDYYTSKTITPLDENEINKLIHEEKALNFDELFSNEKVTLTQESVSLESDRNILYGIANNEYDIKTLDYDGVKYKANDAYNLIAEIDEEIKKIKLQVEENDKNIFIHFYSLAKKQGKEEELIKFYHNYYTISKGLDKKVEFFNKLVSAVNFVNHTLSYDEIKSNLRSLIIEEHELKKEVRYYLESESMKDEIQKPMREELEKYISQDWAYFDNNLYVDDTLIMLFNSIDYYNYLISREYFLSQRNLVNFQATIYKGS